MDLSNVMLVCPKCDKPTRVGYKIKDDGFKTRVCKQCNEDID
jgi:large subunit ribosomal protein L24